MSQNLHEINNDRQYYVGPHPGVLLSDPDTHEQTASKRYLPEILLTTTDLPRLARLVTDTTPDDDPAAQFLSSEIKRARVVPPTATPADVVTMRSQILFRYDDVPQHHEVTLLYPGDPSRYQRKLSVLTPMGAALLGLFEGQVMPFMQTDGSIHRVTVVKVSFQPEAHGMYWL